MNQYGVDSKIGMIVSTIMGSTETTLYTIAIYTSVVKIKNSRGIFGAALIGDIVGMDLREEAEKEVDEGEYLTLESSFPHWLVCYLAGVAEVGGLTRLLVPRHLDDDC